MSSPSTPTMLKSEDAIKVGANDFIVKSKIPRTYNRVTIVPTERKIELQKLWSNKQVPGQSLKFVTEAPIGSNTACSENQL